MASSLCILPSPATSGVVNGNRISSRRALAARAAVKPRINQRAARLVVHAATEGPSVPLNSVESTANKMGFDTDEGIFGFTPFSELWVGRLAMAGFAVGVAEELWTGQGILQQIGIDAPNPSVAIALTALLVGGTMGGAMATVFRAENGSMKVRDATRLKRLFGLGKDAEVGEAVALSMKQKGDFTSIQDLDEVVAAQMDGTPADGVLAFDDISPANDASLRMKVEGDFTSRDNQLDISQDASRLDVLRTPFNTIAEAAEAPTASRVNYDDPSRAVSEGYIWDVEMNNGRAAMLGFAAAVLVEAYTGHGTLQQVYGYLKDLGMVGYFPTLATTSLAMNPLFGLF